MLITLTASGDEDALILLYRWLSADEELRGRVRRRLGQVEPGTLGPISEALLIEVGPAIDALTAMLVAWLRRRRGTVEIEASNPDGTTVKIRAEDVRALDYEGLNALSVDLTRRLTDGAQPLPAGRGPAGEGQARQA